MSCAVNLVVTHACSNPQSKMMPKRKALWLIACVAILALLPMGAGAAMASSPVERIAALIDPAKLSTLGKRAANPRVQKYVAQLADVRSAGMNVSNVVFEAVSQVGMRGDASKLTVEAMLRNLVIAGQMGCLGADGLKEMRRGKSATVRRGPYAGDQLSVDHIIPRAVVTELDNVIANLELMPLRMNEGKNDKVGARQLDLAKKLNAAGLLSKSGLKKVREAGR